MPLWPWHAARLERGGVSASVIAHAEERVDEAAEQWRDIGTRRGRLTLVIQPDGSVSVDVAQRLSSLDVPNGPIVARVDVDDLPPFRMVLAKAADRLWWDAAHRRAEALGAHQAIVVGLDGTIIDGSTAAVWIGEGAHLVTPPAPPATPSVSAEFIRAQAARSGLEVRTEPISWQRFEAADEAFLSNAFGGAVAVRRRGGRLHGKVAEFFEVAWMPVWRG